MSRSISEFLNINQPLFTRQIQELENMIGRPGLDIKLSNELALLFKEKAGSLGLDEQDTTLDELYFSMVRLSLEDSDKLARIIGIEETDPPKLMVEKSVHFIEKRIGRKTVWSLKPNICRRQLKDNPPKKLMKIFGIRSIDSALKREKVSSFYCFARLSESRSWIDKYASQAASLTNSDFDNQKIIISILSAKKQDQLKKSGIKLNQVIYFDQESASIEIAVPQNRFKGDVLFITDSLIMQIKDMLWRSMYYKSQGLRPGFYSKVERIRSNGFASVYKDNYPFDWPTVLHAAVEKGAIDLLQKQEPFISKDELLVPSIVQLGGLEFWKHPFGFYSRQGSLISFNLSDMILNAVNGILPKDAYVQNGRMNLKNELFSRYLAYDPISDLYLST